MVCWKIQGSKPSLGSSGTPDLLVVELNFKLRKSTAAVLTIKKTQGICKFLNSNHFNLIHTIFVSLHKQADKGSFSVFCLRVCLTICPSHFLCQPVSVGDCVRLLEHLWFTELTAVSDVLHVRIAL